MVGGEGGAGALVVGGGFEIGAEDARALGVTDGDGLQVGDIATLEVRINSRVAAGCAAYSAGFPGTENIEPLSGATLRRADNWQRREPQLIGTDRGVGATPGSRHV